MYQNSNFMRFIQSKLDYLTNLGAVKKTSPNYHTPWYNDPVSGMDGQLIGPKEQLTHL